MVPARMLACVLVFLQVHEAIAAHRYLRHFASTIRKQASTPLACSSRPDGSFVNAAKSACGVKPDDLSRCDPLYKKLPPFPAGVHSIAGQTKLPNAVSVNSEVSSKMEDFYVEKDAQVAKFKGESYPAEHVAKAVQSILQKDAGFIPEKTLLVHSTCPDEINCG